MPKRTPVENAQRRMTSWTNGEHRYTDVAADVRVLLARINELESLTARQARELTRHRQVITEYVGEVESGEKFDALVRLVPGLPSDDGAYGGN